ncbi:KPN_02809 family neutral zinc metallopeptidase [Zavarzinella formosa]|uniref:KPN_02809 family neutral zinc metallopeptidase n=1 Tax=Zavarzinella formosa TaxID=360055 RepID=UPI0002F146BF|nr:neutral zinc metallopeptidase [Zavarzinella formosa]
MQMSDETESENVEDRRGMGGPMAVGGGLGGLSIIGIIIFLIQGGDPKQILDKVQQQQGAQQGHVSAKQNDAEKVFVSKVLHLTEDVWEEQFREQGMRYKKPKLVVFNGVTNTACGQGESAMGPFYCPGDQQVYIDLDFFAELRKLTGTSADFARAYVIAHEVGHHVQNLMGYSQKVDSQRGRVSKEAMNQLSVRLELQADYLAGVWGYHANKQKKILEPGDIESGLQAAQGIGDDKLQQGAGRAVRPESFTHGTSKQREFFLKTGLQRGDASKKTLDYFFTVPYERLGRDFPE